MKEQNLVLAIFILILVLLFPAKAMLNPAEVYCKELGYKYLINNEGYGICVLPNGSEVDAWKFLQGKVAKEYSYCNKAGYEIKTVHDPEKCIKFLLDECAVCILPNGSEVEVTKLMNLSFEETTCGDGNCGLPENYKTCPQDCPSGSYDGYCDGVYDGICDQDCIDRNTPNLDPDCPKPTKCGNGKCEEGENQNNCCIDCGCPSGRKCINNKCIEIKRCGNGKCESGENYKTCPQDCPSGSYDGYCDKVKDLICDPDCSRKEDEDCLCNKNGVCESEYEDYLNCPSDCEKPTFPYLIVSIPVAIIIIILVYLIYSKSKKYERSY